MNKKCAFGPCQVLIKSHLLMCVVHWEMVNPVIQLKVYATAKKYQNTDARAGLKEFNSARLAWREAAGEACRSVAVRLGLVKRSKVDLESKINSDESEKE